MKKASVLRYAAIGMASLGMAGMAAASSVSVAGGTNSATGPDSSIEVALNNHSSFKLSNTNGVGVGDTSIQGASSGGVKAYKNTTVGEDGSVASGDAKNSNDTKTMVAITNGGVGSSILGALSGLGSGTGGSDVSIAGGAGSATGPDSSVNVDIDNSHKVKVTNTNMVEVVNTSVQGASSGDVSVSKNTKVGSAGSGSASNDNTTVNSVEIHN